MHSLGHLWPECTRKCHCFAGQDRKGMSGGVPQIALSTRIHYSFIPENKIFGAFFPIIIIVILFEQTSFQKL